MTTTTETATETRNLMRQIVADYQDARTGEVNCTGLAEEAAYALDLYERGPDFPIPEWVFELAMRVGEAFEAAR
ncbi:MAG TPA: hypothetical protein VIY27_04355 [Myxococcota bacterium]